MSETIASPLLPPWVHAVGRYRSLLVPAAFIGLIMVIVVPLPPAVIDLLIVANIALAAIILLTSIYVESPLDFSVFPSLLLGTTLFRLVLNIATTRLILSADAQTPEEAMFVAGHVVQAFAGFVAGNDVVVGLILFVILIIVQFVVITKGATRISEVAARFTLDAMPGKQLAIDADLNAGIINEPEARRRRERITQEADFYGAMDGAGKFVRGDAVAGILITIVNVVGGFAIGTFERGWGWQESLGVFTRLTIGDGLVSQLPALVISIGAGLIVTRSSSRQDLGTELTHQLVGRSIPLGMTAVFLGLLAFTGLPALPLLMMAGGLGGMAYAITRKGKIVKAQDDAEAARKAVPPPPAIEQSMAVDTMELEVGYALVRLVDTSQGGDLLDRITAIRRQLATELGLVMPPVRIRDNMQLQPHDYHIRIRGNSVAQSQVYPGQFLAMDSGLATGTLPGVRTREPAFGLEAVWVDAGSKQRAESMNYTVVDATSVLATHLTEVVKSHAHELLSREETNNLITQLRQRAGKLTEEVLGTGDKPGLLRAGELQKVLQNLLRERVPIRDMETIVETLGDWAGRTKDVDILTEYARNGLRRTICNQYVEIVSGEDATGQRLSGAPRLYCVGLDPALEDRIGSYIERSSEGTVMSMPPSVASRVTQSILTELNRLVQGGHQPVVLASPPVRAQVRRLLEPHMPTAAVLGYNEISKGVEVESIGLAQLESPAMSEAA